MGPLDLGSTLDICISIYKRRACPPTSTARSPSQHVRASSRRGPPVTAMVSRVRAHGAGATPARLPREGTTPGFHGAIASRQPCCTHVDQSSPHSSTSLRTVRQLRRVLVVASAESKYWLDSFVRATPFGRRR